MGDKGCMLYEFVVYEYVTGAGKISRKSQLLIFSNRLKIVICDEILDLGFSPLCDSSKCFLLKHINFVSKFKLKTFQKSILEKYV